jgi:hypothetical protein
MTENGFKRRRRQDRRRRHFETETPAGL